MSFFSNATSHEGVKAFSLPLPTQLAFVQETSPVILAVAVFFGAHIVAVIINVLWQLLIPQDPSLPPLVFHWLPIIGSAIQYGNDPLNFFLECREKYGDVFTFVLIGRKITVALGPKGSNLILGGKPTQVSAEDAYTHLTTPVFGKHVVYDCPNETLMEQKKFVKFGLSTDNFRAYMGMIEDETLNVLKNDPHYKALHSASREWGSFHCFKAMSELTILTASRTLQGKEVRSRLDKTFAQRYMDLDGGFTPINFLFPNLPLPSYWRRDRAQKAMSEFYQEIIRERKTGNHEHDHDMLAALATQKYRDGRPLNDVEMAHIMIALLMAGQHTSSATSSWTLLHLADRPDVQQQLYDEQVALCQQSDGSLRSLEYEDLKQLPVLDRVIRETLRMHPPIHSIMRKVKQDLVVPQTLAAPSENSSYVIPTGHYVLASPSVAQMDPRIWKDHETWDPSRWADTQSVTVAATMKDESEKVDYGFGMISKGTESPYQPFGAGRHRCIGEQFAYLQLSAIIATIIRHVELRLPGKVPPQNYHTMIVLPKDPCDIQYRRRENAPPL